MLEQPDSPSVSQTKKQVFDHYLYRLQSEIHMILSAESANESRVNGLESELEVFKRACFAAENEKRQLTEEVAVLKQQVESLESLKSTSEKRIVCLIDGNSSIFSTDLMVKGQEGGRLASKLLSESVHYHLTSAQPCHLWTYVYFNKKALLDALSKAGGVYKEARDRFEEFLLGFNQACERFVMVDVGNDDDAAVAKMKVHLDFHARSQETYKVVFGGCHNNGYASQLHSLQLTSVYRDRLVLLPAFTNTASEITKLQLPSLVIPGLFVPDNIISIPYSRQQSTSSTTRADGTSSTRYGPPPGLPSPASTSRSASVDSPSGSSTPPPPPPYPEQTEANSTSDVIQIKAESEGFLTPSNADRHHRGILGHAAGPVSYRPLAQRWPQDSADAGSESFTRSGGADGVKGSGKQRKINHEIPLSQHNPPPCTLFYLAANGCKHGPDCRFGHDYLLDDDDYEALRMNARRVPCPAANRGELCIFGENCCYGHTCPYQSRCHFFRHGKCKFSGANMHREEELA